MLSAPSVVKVEEDGGTSDYAPVKALTAAMIRVAPQRSSIRLRLVRKAVPNCRTGRGE